MKWVHWCLLFIASFLVVGLSSCDPTQFTTQAGQSPQVVGSTLGDPKTFNAALSQESPAVFGFIYEGLVDMNGITGEIEPALAESWEVSDNGLKLIFTLRDNLQWSDGEPLTVDDVVFSYNQIYLNDEIPTNSRDGLRVGTEGKLPEVRKLDNRRVEFAVPEPFAPFLRATGLEILPAHVLQSAVVERDANGSPKFLSTWGTDTNPAEIICNGPYRLKQYIPGERVVFERNPYY